jgi:hypothetical protein
MASAENPMVADDHLKALEHAITDIGCWRWWDQSLPKTFQVEFSMVQLLNPPMKAGGPPSGLLALRFKRPITVAFVTHADAPKKFSLDWPDLMHADQLGAFSLNRESFSFSERDVFRSVLEGAGRVDTVHGPPPTADALAGAPNKLAFWSGPIGLVVAAEEMIPAGHDGDLSPKDVLDRSRRWWTYWKDYWKRKDRDDALPYDGACEVTIPAG